MNTKHSTLAEYLTLATISLLTIITIYNKQVTVFYLLYLFWCDEFLKTCFDGFRYLFKRSTLNNSETFISATRGRFFFLMIYIVFIIVFYGLIINYREGDIVLNNFSVVLFKNSIFNITLSSLFFREIYLLIKSNNSVQSHHLLSNGIITLHISLILGIFMWFLVNNVFQLLKGLRLTYCNYTFFTIKVVF